MSGGKPEIRFDPTEIEKLATLGHTFADIAFFYDCNVKTVERRIKEPDDGDEPSALWIAFSRGKSKLRMSLRAQQYKIAMGNSKSAAQMLIHMSKHQLGESDAALLRLGKNSDGGLTFIIEE